MEEKLDKLISLMESQNKAWEKCLELLVPFRLLSNFLHIILTQLKMLIPVLLVSVFADYIVLLSV